jgi:bisphosphoglycerate-independent phosphoglycerate mutase (AlkP superfamily)
MTRNKQPIILIILDGWGEAPPSQYNAITLAKTPFWDSIQNQSKTLLETSGEAVGLPHGQMGNSEVGHMTIGCGRVILQDLPMIDAAIQNGEMLEKLSKIRSNKVHLIGLISDGGVHSHMRHIAKMAEILHKNGKQVYIHAICDGRDTPPKSAIKLLEQFSQMLGGNGRICSLSGRYYAMDRDKRWERTQEYLDCLNGVLINNCHLSEGWDPENKEMDSSIRWNDTNPCNKFNTYQEAITNAYQDNISDEFIKPCIIGKFEAIAADDELIECGRLRINYGIGVVNAICSPHMQPSLKMIIILFFPRRICGNLWEK